MSEAPQAQAYALAAGQGRLLWHMGGLITFKALGAETGGHCFVLEGLADQQLAVPLHAHSREEELLYVLEGELSVTLGATTRRVGPGGFVYIPRQLPHTFQVRTGTARYLIIGIPAGLDRWFLETATPAATPTLPPPPAGPTDVAALVASLQTYGTETLGPPPGPEE